MSEMDARVRSMLDEAGIADAGSEDLVRLLSHLEGQYVDDWAPEPGPELAVLLGHGNRAVKTQHGNGSRGRRAAAAGVVALGLVATTGLAAAANELPAPAQRWVARFSQRYLPFDLPSPDAGVRGGAPDPPPTAGASPVRSGPLAPRRRRSRRAASTRRGRRDVPPTMTALRCGTATPATSRRPGSSPRTFASEVSTSHGGGAKTWKGSPTRRRLT